MKNNSETERTLSSFDGLERAQMPAALQSRILASLAAPKTRVFMPHRPTVLLMAAGLALLISFNVYTLVQRQYATSPLPVAGAPNALADDYFIPAPSI